MNADVIIVGAGIAGLSCARIFAEAGRPPIVLERSRGVGGRCATRRVRGQPVDHGVAFLHGSDPEFLAALRGVPGDGRLDGWPTLVAGTGAPCRAEAFSSSETRLTFAQGVTAFPKALADGLDVRLETSVVGIQAGSSGFDLAIDGGPPIHARDVVLAMATEQTRVLLEPLAAVSREAASVAALLEMTGSVPCLTLLAEYPGDVPEPEWQVLYPEDSAILQLVVHDSSKRREPTRPLLVFQARPRWSRANLEVRVGEWNAAIVQEAGRLVGPWASKPSWSAPHRWLHARAQSGSELREPLLLRWPGGCRIGLAGEIFDPCGGLEAAWRSGKALARRLLDEEC